MSILTRCSTVGVAAVRLRVGAGIAIGLLHIEGCPATARLEAKEDLAATQADVDALQPALASTAVYVRSLRRRNAELELRAAAAACGAQKAWPSCCSGSASGNICHSRV